MALRGRHLTWDLDFSSKEIWQIFETAKDLKRRLLLGKPHALLRGKSLAIIFAKPSTRTRVSFEVGMTQLGGNALFLGPNDLQLSRGETIADTGRVLSRYVDGIMARVFAQQDIVDLALHATVPVINGLSDLYHPCQALTDLFTVWEKRGNLTDLAVAFVGDGDNNITNSLMLLAARLGVNFVVASPRKYTVRKKIIRLAQQEAKKSGAKILVTVDPLEAVRQAEVVYTDVWVSMGRTDVLARKKAFARYQVNQRLLRQAAKNVLVMHCLPAHRGEEITDEVIDGSHSIVFDQAENRLHVQKAILSLIM